MENFWPGVNRRKPHEVTMKKKSELNLEEAFAQLESIVQRLESGEESLEDTLKLFEEGTALVNTCQKILDEAEQKIEILDPDTIPEENS